MMRLRRDAPAGRRIEANCLQRPLAMCDRMDIESPGAGAFGKQGAGREGRVWSPRRWVESSLDLDFI